MDRSPSAETPLNLAPDPGFGRRITQSADRLINKDGSYNIVREGQEMWTLYQYLVELSWRRFFTFIIVYYFAINLLFATGFWLLGVENLDGVQGDDIWANLVSCFFFSIQTFTTVGYGAISPEGIPANLLASVNALVGIISSALFTGLLFSRFSKARAQLVFSKDALLAPYHDTGNMSFQFRIANLHHSKVINLRANIFLSWVETDANGNPARRFSNLLLERDQVNLLPLNWTIVHIIDDSSPIKDWEPKDFTQHQAEIIIFIEGFDESFGQRIHVSSSYTCREIRQNARFLPMYHHREGQTILDLDKIHDFEWVK